MKLAKFIDLIEPTELDNTDESQHYGNKSFITKDAVFIESYNEFAIKDYNDRIVYPTDYAVMCGAMISSEGYGRKFRKAACSMLRSAHSLMHVDSSEFDCAHEHTVPHQQFYVVCPSLNLNFEALISSAPEDFRLVTEVGDDCLIKHFIEAGAYPKTFVGRSLNKELENELKKDPSIRKLKETGAWPGYFRPNKGDIEMNVEYEYNGQKYVRVSLSLIDEDTELADGTLVWNYNEYMWVKLEPIKWEITNWDELPKELNPLGKGTAKTVKLTTEEGIISGIPFYPNGYNGNRTMWQNSTIRGFLNGINVNNIKENGNPEFSAPNGGDFGKGFNFLSLAFGGTSRTSSYEEETEKAQTPKYSRKSRLQKLNPDKTPKEQRRKIADTEKK